jgi:hypothetical protein
MELPGYDDEDLCYDGEALLRRPGYFAVHLLQAADLGLDELTDVFGLDPDEVSSADAEIRSSEAWPVLQVPLRDGARIAVVWRNYEDDAGVDYLLLPAGGAKAITLAVLDGHQFGPGISWPELRAVAGRAADPVRAAQILVLLAPMMADAAAGEDAVADLAVALRAVGVTGDAEELARMLVEEHALFEPEHWHAGEDGVTVCDGELSFRNPAQPRIAMLPEVLRTVSELLRP